MIKHFESALDIIKQVVPIEHHQALETHLEYVEALEEFYNLVTTDDFWTHEEMKRYQKVRQTLYNVKNKVDIST